MAELANCLLTAGHDLDMVQPPVRLDVADGTERYTLYSGQEQELKSGDMYIADQEGIISNVLYGPDRRTRIVDSTRSVLFTVYGVPGISRNSVDRHLADLEANVRLVSTEAQTELREEVSGG
jgi:DNA/RNA-binding domain of Phe-tRNA-synthetase-like protein